MTKMHTAHVFKGEVYIKNTTPPPGVRGWDTRHRRRTRCRTQPPCFWKWLCAFVSPKACLQVSICPSSNTLHPHKTSLELHIFFIRGDRTVPIVPQHCNLSHKQQKVHVCQKQLFHGLKKEDEQKRLLGEKLFLWVLI